MDYFNIKRDHAGPKNPTMLSYSISSKVIVMQHQDVCVGSTLHVGFNVLVDVEVVERCLNRSSYDGMRLRNLIRKCPSSSIVYWS